MESTPGARERALDLAVRLIRGSTRFSIAQVVNAAAMFEDYIVNGTVPQMNTVQEREGDADADVGG